MSNYIKVLPAVSTPIGATLMKTGQTTSYRTGDDGDLERGRATDFFTLPSNNPFGNNRRFTGTTGGYQTGGINYNKDGGTTTAALAFPNDIVIDWSTYNGTNALGYYRVLSGDVVWNTAIDNSLAFSIGTYTSGWRLPNSTEMISLMYILLTQSHSYNYNPFNFTWTGYFWTSTNASTTVLLMYPFQHSTIILSKTQGSTRYIPVRTFTVTGTTLT